MTTNTKWKSHTKIKDNVLTVLGSSNQLDTHFSYIILSNGFPLSNTGHQLNNHKHNTHPHTHLPGHRCIDAPHRHCTPSNHRRMLKRYCWLKGCHSASQQLRQTISMHLQSVLCTTLYACICPHCHLSSRNVCNAVEFFVCSEGQWSNEYSYAGFASSLTSTIRHPAAPKPEKKYWKVSLYVIYQQPANTQHSFLLDCLTLEPREPHTQRQNFILQKTWIFKNAAERTSNVAHNNHFLCTISNSIRRCKCTK